MPADVSYVHEGKNPFKSVIFHNTYSQKQQMKLHVASVHEEKKPFICGICDYSCSKKHEYVDMLHMFMKVKSHSNVRYVITAFLKSNK